MFERFTETARQVVVLAQAEARSLGHAWIGTEHLLLGLLVAESPVRWALEDEGLTLEATRAAAVALVGSSDTAPVGQIPFTREARRVLEGSLRESARLGTGTIGPEHLLLAVLGTSGTAVCLLRDAAIDVGRLLAAAVRDEGVDPERYGLAAAAPERTVDPADRAAPRPETAAAEFRESPLFDRPARELLEAAKQAKEDAIERDDVPAAAALRLVERRLRAALQDLDRLL
jgi:ATP-dependent Clp protease ATP-binding subunit ClpA